MLISVRAHKSFSGVLSEYFEAAAKFVKPEQISVAYFGMAGPVHDNKVNFVEEVGWEIVDAAKIEAEFSLRRVVFVNDMVAHAQAVLALPSTSFVNLSGATPTKASVKLVLGLGTGIGVSFLTHRGPQAQENDYEIHPSEAGSCEFSAHSAEEFAIH